MLHPSKPKGNSSSVLNASAWGSRAITSLYDLTLPELTDWLKGQGQPAYRAKQIFHELYQRGIADVSAITTLPKELREKLAEEFLSSTLSSVEMQKSSDGTMKHLSKLSDGELLETVLIPAQRRLRPSEAAPLTPPGARLRQKDAAPDSSAQRRTVCVSTQVGCAYACTFCASGMDGFRRNLTAGEIVQQVLLVQNTLKERVTNVVFMGMGEPLANYDNLLKAIRILNSPEGLHLGARKMTVSTVGLVPMIERLSQEGLQIELSISLHAPSDELRGKIMPVNKKYPVAELIKACHDYVTATNRLITFEYILIHEVNDDVEQAKELVELLKDLKAKVNLIPCHPTPDTPWQRPPLSRMLAFEHVLHDHHIPCTLRRSRGLDIDGACGQLRLRLSEAAPLTPPGARLWHEDAAPLPPPGSRLRQL